MDLKQLSTFHRVMTHMSFTKAATELRYAQSSVTAQIKSLEAALGMELFERFGGKIRLTPVGERLVPYVERILALVDEARSSLADETEPSGTLTIGAVESLISYRMPAVLEFFYHRYPQMQLILQSTTCREAHESLRRGMLDVGFLIEPENRHHGLETKVLGAERLVAVVAPGHPLDRTAQVSTSDLRMFPVLAPGTNCSYRALMESDFNKGADTPVSLIEFGNIESVKQGIATGIGISVLPATAVASAVKEARLSVLDWQPSFEVFAQIVWRQGRKLNRETRIFIDVVSQTMCQDGESLLDSSSTAPLGRRTKAQGTPGSIRPSA
ncbi:LysR family transcriptional regulator [Actinophytocola gossypii]|uniref:LysR family transcriptional regulator n=1 Tax=Actinophytocola gossypii TaxID=2812003 RepID=A0ABT2J345_9PSEU|nr:LysR family transcriptional regulator [Actinophytocola gossypii]MCT2582278.1 LysR family transcriptional regulator [Actinophytocola gossypii]